MRLSTYPPPFPAGWYRVAASADLRRGKILYRECLGTQMVIFRSDEDGLPRAMGAFCPHLGANLSGGCVKNGGVECPFHRWTIGGDGRVADIPYADKLPPKARQQVWPTVERYGQIFIYHRGNAAELDPDIEPPYELPQIADLDDGTLVYRGSYAPPNVHMHIIEFTENSVDFQHFQPLHGKMTIPWTSIPLPGVDIKHTAHWEPDPDQPHIAYFHDHAIVKLFGREMEKSQANAVITFIGPAGVTTFRISIPELGDVLMFHTHLPVGPMEQEVRFRWFADPKIPRLLVKYVIGNWISQWRNDIDIWENKIHLARPVLAKGDGPLHRARKWFSQFYPESPERTDEPMPAESAAE